MASSRPSRPNRPTSILFSEGSSLTARQTLSALGPLGYTIDIVDPNPMCIGRFSRFVRHTYRCPPMGRDPEGYLAFVTERLEKGSYDVLLPVHEQAYLFSRHADRLRAQASLALASFAAFRQVQSKAAFARTLDRLGLPQPETCLVRTRAELESCDHYPFYVKAPYSTAGSGVWEVEDAADLYIVGNALEDADLLSGDVDIVVQNVARGDLCQAQSVFERGELIAAHCTTQRAVGVGGSQSARLSVDHPVVREHLAILGRHLNWHGALTLDYLSAHASGQPSYIECNPRLVEPMNGVFSGINLADILVRLSLDESFAQEGKPPVVGRADVRSHSLLATLLGMVVVRGATRAQLGGEIGRCLLHRGLYAHSREDLTPLWRDPKSLFPLAYACFHLLRDPTSARQFTGHTISDYALSPRAVAWIEKGRGVRREDSSQGV